MSPLDLAEMLADAADEGSCDAAALARTPPRRHPRVEVTRLAPQGREALRALAVARWIDDADVYGVRGVL